MTKDKRIGPGATVLFAFVLWQIVPFLLIGCGREKAQFVDGPEATDLSERMRGHLLINQGWDSAEPNPPGLIAISFPKAEQTTVRLASKSYLDISRISGPDRNGTIAFVRSSEMVASKDRWYSLQTIRLDGTNEKEVFRRKGDLLWNHLMGEIALSPSNGRVAFVGYGPSVQYPGALLNTGPIEIWDVNSSTGYNTGISAFDERLWWLPDGQRLVFVTAVGREALSNTADLPGSPHGQTYEKQFGRWHRYPAACILDLATKQYEILLPGIDPVLSTDGKKLMTRSGDRWLLLDLETKKIELFDPPSQWLMPVLLLPGNLAIFEARPRAGTTPRWLTRGSFRVGNQMWSLKVGRLGTWQTQTIVPYMDVRDGISFGITG